MKKIFIIFYMLVLSCVIFGQQTMPSFDGGKGMEKLGGYLISQLNNPEERNEKIDSIAGNFVVLVKFSVDVDGSVIDTEIYQILDAADGSVVDTKIYQSVHPILDKEVSRVFNSIPKDKWTPTFNNGGKPVKTAGIIYPVIFTDRSRDIKMTPGPTHQAR